MGGEAPSAHGSMHITRSPLCAKENRCHAPRSCAGHPKGPCSPHDRTPSPLQEQRRTLPSRNGHDGSMLVLKSRPLTTFVVFLASGGLPRLRHKLFWRCYYWNRSIDRKTTAAAVESNNDNSDPALHMTTRILKTVSKQLPPPLSSLPRGLSAA